MGSLIWFAVLLGDLAGAEAALEAGKYREALTKLGEVDDLDKADQRTLVVIGMAHFHLGEYVAAIEPLLRASDGAPHKLKLARAAALACKRSARGTYAMEYLRDARRMARRSGDVSLEADVAYLQSDFESALAYYGDAEAPADKQRAMVYARRRAECLRALGRNDELRAAYLKALDAALAIPDLRSAYRLAFRGEIPGRLLQWLDQRIEEKPDHVQFRRYRGFARAVTLRYAEAIEDLDIVVKANPNDVASRDQLCFVLLQDGARRQIDEHFERADKIARSILKDDIRHRDAWDRLSWLAGKYWAKRKLDKAFDILAFLYATDSQDVSNGLNYGALCRRLDKNDIAEKVYRGLLADWPRDPDVVNDWAIFVDGLGRRDEAVKLWERVLKLQKNNLNALENLYTAHWERGNRSEVDRLLALGLEASRGDKRIHTRWLWFRDRSTWTPVGLAPRR